MAASGARSGACKVRLANRELVVTPVFDTYWEFAAARQAIFARRARGLPAPWTTNPILARHRFTNVYRASDRVSQFLVREVVPGDPSPREVFFRVALFKLFNKISTWRLLRDRVGEIRAETFDHAFYSSVLSGRMRAGEAIYSAAYIIPSPRLGHRRKHDNHFELLSRMLDESLPEKLAAAGSMRDAYGLLLEWPGLGPFLCYQLTVDLNYGPLLDFDENDFVVAGPGAVSGIRKCFADTGGLSDEDVIRLMVDVAPGEFERRGLPFVELWGRPLHAIDCQNLFCEVDKYARVAHPDVSSGSGRTRIKQTFVANPDPVDYRFPDRWGIDTSDPLPVPSMADA